MLDFLMMWKNPKMVAYVALTAVLYVVLVLPFMKYSIFGGHGDFGRIGVGVVAAFSLLFGPATAWGTAIGSTIRDALTSGLDTVSIFGFVANFILGYVPYKLWKVLSSAKPDLRNLKKVALFAAVNLAACAICGVIVGWALYWLSPPVPFMPTSLIIAVSDAVWAILLGSVILALSYKPLSKRRLLYTDLMCEKPRKWSKTRTAAALAFVVCTVICFVVGALWVVDPFVLLAPALLSFVCLVYTLR
jgi:energy-coupling factor transport system substrate-specific component